MSEVEKFPIVVAAVWADVNAFLISASTFVAESVSPFIFLIVSPAVAIFSPIEPSLSTTSLIFQKSHLVF